MICRAPLLTEKQLVDLTILVRMNWIMDMRNLVTQQMAGGKNSLEIVADVTKLTDLYKPLFDPVVLWSFQIHTARAREVRTIMKPELHEEYLKLAHHTQIQFDIATLSPEARYQLDDFEQLRQGLIKVLEEAPAVDPEIVTQQIPPSGKTSTNLN